MTIGKHQARSRTKRTPAAVPRRRRVKIAEAVALLGVEARTVRDMAQRGELAGAAKIGGIWTFDIDALQRFIADRERCAATPHISRPRSRPLVAYRPQRPGDYQATIEHLKKLVKQEK